jgi:hypothetical protein
MEIELLLEVWHHFLNVYSSKVSLNAISDDFMLNVVGVLTLVQVETDILVE